MRKPNPKQLYKSLWCEGELCCLYADTNLGKSILAVQIGEDICKSIQDDEGNPSTVIYFDFEMSDKQFQLRYTDGENRHVFPNTFKRATVNPAAFQNCEEDSFLKSIESVITTEKSKVVIVDNLTWLCDESEKGVNATKLMKDLQALKIKYNLSMLVIAHTPKRDMTRPLTNNDLAGSRRLLVFFDAAFAIGKSAIDENLRYIKEIKCRSGNFCYDADNIMLMEICKAEDGFLHFEEKGYSTEREHLKAFTDDENAELKSNILSLKSEGLSLHKIADKLGVSYSKVQRFTKIGSSGSTGSSGSLVHREPTEPTEPSELPF